MGSVRLTKGITCMFPVRLVTTLSEPYFLFVFEVNNEHVKFSLPYSSAGPQPTILCQFEVTTDTYFDLAGDFIYSIYETPTETLTIPDSERLTTGYCTVIDEGVEYTEHEPDNAYTVR